MPIFTYTARHSEGYQVQGSIEAHSLQAAREALKQMGVEPEDLQEKKVLQDNVPSVDSLSPAPTATPPVQEKQATQQEGLLTPPPQKIYFPIVETLRLYAGWLLAGYFLAYVLGAYQLTKPLPFQIPYVLAFVYSPLILSFTLAAFLFLLFSQIHRFLGKGVLKGFTLSIVASVCFVLYRLNA